MKKVLIINSHWNNRGDEAAIRSLIDSLLCKGICITIQLETPDITLFPYNEVSVLTEYPRIRHIPEFVLGVVSGFRITTKRSAPFFKALKEADLVIHGPGGPSIGDIYYKKEINYLLRFWAVMELNKPYIICAPSAGPFRKKIRNNFRKKMYENAKEIIFREDISQKYLNELMPCNKSVVTCDLALQNSIDEELNEIILCRDKELSDFLYDQQKVIGITITHLQWHPKYAGLEDVKSKIAGAFHGCIRQLINRNYKVLFIPQQFGTDNDYDYMKDFAIRNCYVMPDTYDCYFQQYIISKLHSVIGMRYHSNIFSAKMSVPFISISYEQKMRGFAEKINYSDFCIDIDELSEDTIIDKFDLLEGKYSEIQTFLCNLNSDLRELSSETIKIVMKYI